MTVAANAPSSLEEFVERYYQAYNDHDLEAILALHAPDAEYRIHGAHTPARFRGVEALREIYTHHLQGWPDQRLEVQSAVISGDLCVTHVTVTGTLVVPWELAGRTFEPIGRPITFEIAHAIQFEGNLVKVKDGWIDGLAMHNQLAAGAG